ncbi:ATP-binding protein [Raineyella sp. LH-20]|uniref:ATP-binding protein n=1 Tax=Raineyella sp. LH-20 TaxID=3081204 RepID=UPI002953F676|nr:ATP-binding protein [Raineyella sp. LH-20]WOP19279.1 ATP-binding protein [Raineyella sp. LH-20]
MFPSCDDYEKMALHTRTGILVHEAASKNIIWANPTACAMFGFTLEELRPLKAHHMSGREKEFRREIGVAWLQDAVDHGISRRRWKYRSKDGRDFLTDAVATLVDFQDGPAVMVQFRSIDAEVEVASELARTTDYLQRLMTYASAGIVLLDEDDRIVDISDFAARLFHAPAAVLVGRRLGEVALLGPEFTDAAPSSGPGRPGPVEFRLEVAGEDGPVWLSGQLEDVAHDGIESRLLTLRDITAKVESEREQAYQEANLQYLSRYNAMGDMAMVIAHELGQPLAAAGNFLSGIMSRLEAGTLEQADVRYAIERAERQLTRSAEIVASVKRYVQRIESTAGPQDLNAIVAESLYFVRLRAAERGVTVEERLSGQPLPITGESVLIGQVILNFCLNAIDEVSRPENADRHIRVTSRREPGWACCSVADWGRGMAAVPGDRLLSSAFSNKVDGSGIGLVLSERIVERHAGTVTIERGDPSGTVVTLRLPLADGPAPGPGV